MGATIGYGAKPVNVVVTSRCEHCRNSGRSVFTGFCSARCTAKRSTRGRSWTCTPARNFARPRRATTTRCSVRTGYPVQSGTPCRADATTTPATMHRPRSMPRVSSTPTTATRNDTRCVTPRQSGETVRRRSGCRRHEPGGLSRHTRAPDMARRRRRCTYSVCSRSPRAKPSSGASMPRPTASTLKSSPISCGVVSRCTARAARM